MENKFTLTIHRFSDGYWKFVSSQHGIDCIIKRRLIYAAKSLGYIYSPIHHAYIYRKNGLVIAIAKFTKDN